MSTIGGNLLLRGVEMKRKMYTHVGGYSPELKKTYDPYSSVTFVGSALAVKLLYHY